MSGPACWRTTTHVWADHVDQGHLAAIRADPSRFTDGLTHLVLEVLAYAAEEAEARGVIGHCDVIVHGDGSISVADDGRGTQTRRDDSGRMIRKPIMATRDVRFFGMDDARLADGLPRHGMSVVAALSAWLRHTNHRVEGSWSQEYLHGVPLEELRAVEPSGRSGTAVRFLLDADLVPETRLDEAVLADPRLEIRVRRDAD